MERKEVFCARFLKEAYDVDLVDRVMVGIPKIGRSSPMLTYEAWKARVELLQGCQKATN